MFHFLPLPPPPHLSSRKTMLVLHCKMQTEFRLFIKDEAKHFSAFLPLALWFSMTQTKSEPTVQRAGPSLTDPRREVTALLRDQPSGFYTFSLGFPFTGSFRGHLSLGQVCLLVHKKRWVNQALGMYYQTNKTVGGRSGSCINIKHTMVEGKLGQEWIRALVTCLGSRITEGRKECKNSLPLVLRVASVSL